MVLLHEIKWCIRQYCKKYTLSLTATILTFFHTEKIQSVLNCDMVILWHNYKKTFDINISKSHFLQLLRTVRCVNRLENETKINSKISPIQWVWMFGNTKKRSRPKLRTHIFLRFSHMIVQRNNPSGSLVQWTFRNELLQMNDQLAFVICLKFFQSNIHIPYMRWCSCASVEIDHLIICTKSETL